MSDPTPFFVPGLADLSQLAVSAELAELTSRSRSLVASLPATEAPDARRVLELAGASIMGLAGVHTDDPNVATRIELRGLAERLGRRSAEGIPFASLARAVSASLHGSVADASQIRAECDMQLLTFGL